MSRYERRNYFESLVTMRLAYEVLDEADRTAVITIDEVIALGRARGSRPHTPPDLSRGSSPDRTASFGR